MSRSPRKLLGRADDALAAFFDVCEPYADARDQVLGAIGDAGWHELTAAGDDVRQRAQELDRAGGEPREREDR